MRKTKKKTGNQNNYLSGQLSQLKLERFLKSFICTKSF